MSRAAATTVGTRALRLRLVASLAVAALVPFAAAWWISNTYVTDEEVDRVDEHLALAVDAAVLQAQRTGVAARSQALRLARDRRIQLALLGRDRRALQALLRAGEAVRLAGGGSVGKIAVGTPTVGVEVASQGRRLGTIVVALPTNGPLLRQISPFPASAGAGEIALARNGTLATGPLSGARLGTGTTLTAKGTVYRVRSGALPGFPPGTRVVALADQRAVDVALRRLGERLALGGAVSLAAVILLVLALGRPLLHGLGRVEHVAQQATIDSLTGLANRRGFEQALAVELERCSRYGSVCSVAIADLDDFKRVNDRHGHAVGDEALRTLAGVLEEAIRSVDVAARLGGEEFAVLMPETDPDGARRLAERVRVALEQLAIPTPSGDRLRVTASIGVASTSPTHAGAVLVREADRALYAAKEAGKNRVAVSGVDTAHAPAESPPQPVGTP